MWCSGPDDSCVCVCVCVCVCIQAAAALNDIKVRITEKAQVAYDAGRVRLSDIKQAVKAGLGIAVMSKFSFGEEVKHGTLKELKLKDVRMTRKIYIVTRRKRTLPRLYQLFLEHVKPLSQTPRPILLRCQARSQNPSNTSTFRCSRQ